MDTGFSCPEGFEFVKGTTKRFGELHFFLLRCLGCGMEIDLRGTDGIINQDKVNSQASSHNAVCEGGQ
jgi:hypothetical protein